MNRSDADVRVLRMGYYSSGFLALITIITFGFAITAVPISGVFCPANCIEYPYLDSISHYPKDYLWMFLAIPLIITYLIFVASVYSFAAIQDRIFGRIGLTFAIICSAILLMCYFTQFSVIPISLLNGETEGLALFTQYNPHGMFIALEELGYLLMSLSFLFIAPVFANRNRIENTIRWIFILAFILTLVSFTFIIIKFGIRRDYRFEIAVISFNWLTLIINGILAGIVFRKELLLQQNVK